MIYLSATNKFCRPRNLLIYSGLKTDASELGICALPAIQGSCPHANACLRCVHFRTTKEFLPQHQKQLEKTNQIIAQAQEKGWQRQAEMNLTVKKNLENIVQTLEKTA